MERYIHLSNSQSLYLSFKTASNLLTASGDKGYSGAIRVQQEALKQIWKARVPEKATIRNSQLYYDLRTSLSDDLLMYTN
jgi:hypothetical protein